jgi:hypothetical protein
LGRLLYFGGGPRSSVLSGGLLLRAARRS